MRSRHLQIIALFLRSLWRRFINDLAKELTIAFCAAIIISLMAYLARDFLSSEISEIAPTMTQGFRWGVSVALWLIAFRTAQTIARENSELKKIGNLSLRLGEQPFYYARAAQWIRTGSMGLLLGFASALILYFILPEAFRLLMMAWILGVSLSIPARVNFGERVRHLLKNMGAKKLKRSTMRPQNLLYGSLPRALSSWRWSQIKSRNPRARFWTRCGEFLILVLFFWILFGGPDLGAQILAWIIGLSIVWILSTQLHEDIPAAWIERQAGVGHDDFCRGYDRFAFEVLKKPVLSVFLGYLLAHIFTDGALSIFMMGKATKLAVITAIPPLVFSPLMFQIDARRPLIQFAIVSMLSFIAVSAFIAHWIGLIVIIIIRSVANDAQKGRFQRA